MRIHTLLSICLVSALQLGAAVPGPEQLLPADTLAVFSIPDWDKAKAYYDKAPQAQLWQDPAVKPFKDNLLKQLDEHLVKPLERQLGIEFDDFAGLAHGQLTFALTRNGWEGKPDQAPGFLMLVDCHGKEDQVKTLVTALRKKWVDAGKQIKTEQVRDVEFATLVVKPEDVKGMLKSITGQSGDEPDAETKAKPFELSIGQSGSLLLAGTQRNDLERILARQAGGGVPSLIEQADFQANHSAMFRDSLFFGWLNFKPIYEVLSRVLTEAARARKEGAMPFEPDKLLGATGLAGLKTIAFKVSGNQEGSFAEFALGVPESNRQGLFKILAAERKDAAPPPFVPGEAVKFSRWRIDGQKAWATLEGMINSVSPQMSAMLQMSLSMLGKEKDPNFDLKKDLIGNLGDDFVTFQKNPRGATLADLSAAPALFLIGSSNAEKLAQALKSGVSIMPMASPDLALKEREFLGRKIYSMPLPSMPNEGEGKPAANQSFHFTASAGYVAISTDAGILEEFLRSGESRGKTLRETTGLAEAAQRVGGMNTGFFGFENQSETMKATLEALKNDSAKLKNLLALASFGGKGSGKGAQLDDWFDFNLLPSFEKVAKYFHFVVYSGNVTAEGLSWKVFAPTPPLLR